MADTCRCTAAAPPSASLLSKPRTLLCTHADSHSEEIQKLWVSRAWEGMREPLVKHPEASVSKPGLPAGLGSHCYWVPDLSPHQPHPKKDPTRLQT